MIPRRLTPPDSGPGTSDHTLLHDGLPRAYRVHLPPRLPVGAPLVIQLHGGGGNGRGLDRLTRFHALGDQERFAVVSPDAVNHRWNDGRVAANQVDDVGFVAALIDAVAAALPIDRSRVYAVGISNGAMLAARLAAQIPDRIAAFGQVAGTAAHDATRWWRPDRPVPFVQVHGTADPIIAYAGGPLPPRRRGGPDRGAAIGVNAWADLVTAHNGATGPDVEEVPPDVSVRRWQGPTAQSDVEFWAVEGGGHTWPGGYQYMPEAMIGPTTATFDATTAIWRFVSRHFL
jgi:polyhydroxybutyrate depolymerase